MDAAHDGGEGWRKEQTLKLRQRGVLVIDPCNKPMIGGSRDELSGRLDINQMKVEGRFDEIRSKYGEEIRGQDLNYVDVSTFILAHFNAHVPTCGSYEEVFWANRCKKPVIVHYEQGKEYIPNWMFLTFPEKMMFGNWNDVDSYLEYIDNAPEVDSLGRWKFIDWARIIRDTERVYGPL